MAEGLLDTNIVIHAYANDEHSRAQQGVPGLPRGA
jgi:hypothetical protein